MQLIRKVHECEELKILSTDGSVVFELDGEKRIVSGRNDLYLQVGNLINVNEITVMLQWVEDEDTFIRHWVRVKERASVCPMFELPEGALMR